MPNLYSFTRFDSIGGAYIAANIFEEGVVLKDALKETGDLAKGLVGREIRRGTLAVVIAEAELMLLRHYIPLTRELEESPEKDLKKRFLDFLDYHYVLFGTHLDLNQDVTDVYENSMLKKQGLSVPRERGRILKFDEETQLPLEIITPEFDKPPKKGILFSNREINPTRENDNLRVLIGRGSNHISANYWLDYLFRSSTGLGVPLILRVYETK